MERSTNQSSALEGGEATPVLVDAEKMDAAFQNLIANGAGKPARGLPPLLLGRDLPVSATPDKKEMGELVQMIEECGGRISHLCEALLSFARPPRPAAAHRATS